MGREKNLRNLYFKPHYKRFVPVDKEIQGNINLLHEEIEAIYLMDILEMYQEEAAKSMNVSRPTFTSIIKNARQKIALALVNGFQLSILEEKLNGYIIAIPQNEIDSFEETSLQAQFIVIYTINDNTIIDIKILDNPIKIVGTKPAIELPKVFLTYKVNIFIASKIGEGLKNSLSSKGIYPIEKQISSTEEILKEIQ